MADIPDEMTISDVARAAGVSVSTVSRILNNKPDVSKDTRQRVEAVIRELGFTPHAQAQRLAAGRGRTIALLFPTAELNLMSEEFILGAAKAASEASYVFNLMTSTVTRSQLASLFRSAAVDGAILMEIHLSDHRVEYLHRNGFPFVMIGRCANNDGISLVDMDFENGIVSAVQHLVELGHRSIAFMNQSSEMRGQGYGPAIRGHAGYLRACEQFNLKPDVQEADGTAADLFAATHALLDRAPELTALVSMHGDTSIGIVRALQERALRIPDDISLVVFITRRIAELITPPLTSIDFPAYQFGYQAARMLIARLNSSTTVEHIVPPPQLILRKSTAAPSRTAQARIGQVKQEGGMPIASEQTTR